MTNLCGLVLSLFPGAGLLDFVFQDAGWCVVRGPDVLLGHSIENFTVAGLIDNSGRSRFDGIIAGPPCQDFSRARRRPPSGHGEAMLRELARLITEARPGWWLVENVPNVPTIEIPGFVTQRFNMFASDFGLNHRRNRSFQFGSSKGEKLVILRGSQSQLKLKPTPLASDYARTRNLNFAETCERMGLPRGFTLPGLSRRAQFRAVANGVPRPMGYAVAVAIRDRRITRAQSRLCPCDCGRPLTGKQKSATVACRKRLQRIREGHEPAKLALTFTGRVNAIDESHVRSRPGVVTQKASGQVTQ